MEFEWINVESEEGNSSADFGIIESNFRLKFLLIVFKIEMFAVSSLFFFSIILVAFSICNLF